MEYANPQALVSTDWLEENLDRSDLRLVNATWHLPPLKKDARQEHEAEHLPGAVYFDIDEISDQNSDLPHMLPSADAFAAAVGALGIGNDSHVVVYDDYGLFSAARVWWMFRIFGHDRVSLLNGGSLKWKQEGRAVSHDNAGFSPAEFKATFRPELVRSADQMLANIDSGEMQVLDARAHARFIGQAPEPRPGLRSGHIPASTSLSFDQLLDPEAKTLLPAAGLLEVFSRNQVNLQAPVACSCGTGVTACALALGLYLIGHETAAVYDGSWTEWGGREDLPLEV